MYGIVELKKEHLKDLKKFCDSEIGVDYFSMDEIEGFLKKSKKGDTNCSFLMMDGDSIVGIRISYPPGNWAKGKGEGLSEDLWPHCKKETGYFQSLFVHSDYQKQGIGRQLSTAAIQKMKDVGAKGIVCHAWKESPGNTSFHYLRSMGFREIKQHSHYWKNLDYVCPLCGTPCLCTASEMYLDIT